MIHKTMLLKTLAVLIIPAAWCVAQPTDGPPMRGPKGPGPRFGPGHGPPPGPREGPRMILNMFDRVSQKLPEQLDMAPDQKEKYVTMVKKHREEMEAIVKRLAQAWENYQKDLQAMLTPAQQEKLKELKVQRERFRSGHGQGPGMDRPGRGGPGAARAAHAQRFQKAVDQLNLAPEKREQVDKIMKDMRQQIHQVLSPEEVARLKAILQEGRPGGPGGPRRGFGPNGPPEGRGADGSGEDAPPPPPPADEDCLP